jgi:CubicO group peptidase (beta-lactamase class C family)
LEQEISLFQTQFIFNGTILVATQNDVLCSKNIGYADVEHKRSLTANTVFPIASISKQFIAVAILLLREAGKVDLHTPLSHYLGQADPIWQGNLPDWASIITVHQMLTHTNGLTSYTEEKIENVIDHDPIAAMITAIKDKPLKFKTGAQFDYSNTGYLLLGAIIERLTDQTLSQFFEKQLFQKAGMQQTYLPTLDEEIAFIKHFPPKGDLPILYCANLGDLKAPLLRVKQPWKVPLKGAAGIFSTVGDLLKWSNALYQHHIITAKSLALMTTPHIEIHDPWFGDTNYGYGIFVEKKNGLLLYNHGGWIEGVRAMLSFCPKNQTTVIFLSNLSPDESQSEQAQMVQVNAFNDLAYKLQDLIAYRV